MNMIDISLHAMSKDDNVFRRFVNNCDYYVVALPFQDKSDRRFMLLNGKILTNIRVVGVEDLSMFMKSHKVIIQNGNNIVMNFDGE